MATTETVTLTDEQLSDMRETIQRFYGLKSDLDVDVHSSEVKIAGDLVIQIRFDKDRDEFVVDL